MSLLSEGTMTMNNYLSWIKKMIQIYKTLWKLDNKKYTTQMRIKPHKLIYWTDKKDLIISPILQHFQEISK